MKQKRILIVDDDPVVLLTLKEQLSDEGYLVTTASGEREAIRRCRQKKFSLAYVNLIMDPTDGIETTKRLKRLDPQIKVVLMSGDRDELTGRPAKDLKKGELERILEKPIMVDIGRLTKKLLYEGKKTKNPRRG